MIIASLLVLLGIALLYVGAEVLVRGASGFAFRFGISPLIIGLTVVAFGTSAPELLVSVNAALSGNGSIALGNVVGSNICNIGLILGLASVIQPSLVQTSLVRREVPMLIAITALLLLLAYDKTVTRMEGIVLVALFVGFCIWNIRAARKSGVSTEPDISLPVKDNTPLWLQIVMILGGLILLAGGAHWLVEGAVAIAGRLGVSDAVVGLTVVAIGTSLPELATSALAAKRGEADLAVGNVVGSCIFNILCILGITASLTPFSADSISWIDLGMMMGFTIALLPVMISGLRINRLEGAILLASYGGYLLWLVTQA